VDRAILAAWRTNCRVTSLLVKQFPSALWDEKIQGIEALLVLGLESGGRVPPTPACVWRNLPLDVSHILTYFVAHEAHHRGQLVLLARQLGHRLPREVTDALWEWTRLQRTSPRKQASA
jgi:hypothetical protein